MGRRLRKTFPLGKLFRFTLSKSGVSFGIGTRGTKVNFGLTDSWREALLLTVILPGTRH